MGTIDTREHLHSLIALARAYPITLEDIISVPNVATWKHDHGLPETNTMRSATNVLLQSGQSLIVLAQEISEKMQRAVINGMQIRGFLDEVDLLDTPAAFLKHLVLHEVSHMLHPGGDETVHDDWAFEQLSQLC